MSKQQNSSGKNLSTANILAMLSFFLLLPPWGTHRLYLGKHISGFFCFCILPVTFISIMLFGSAIELMQIWFVPLLLCSLVVQILHIIDVIRLSIPKYQDGFVGRAKNTPIFTNEYGQYPINNPMFVYVVLGTITFLSILCFWCSGKIFCFNYDSDYTNYTKCVWVLIGEKNNIYTQGDNNLYGSSGTTFVEMRNSILGPIFAEKITGFILLFIGAIIFAWHYYSKSKPALNTQNQGNYLQNDEVANALANLKRLYDTGAITEAEYNEKRKKYLDSL